MERLSERTINCKYFATQKAIEYLIWHSPIKETED